MSFRKNQFDEMLTGNPQITYFKNVYRRHTYFFKFVDEYEKQTSDSSNGGTPESINKLLVTGSMDLISDIYIKHKLINLSENNQIYANLGNTLINNINMKADQSTINEIDGLAMELLSELENPYIPSSVNNQSVPPVLSLNSNNSLTVNTGNIYNTTCFAGGVSGSTVGAGTSETEVFFTRPNFDFCKYYDKSFPICACYNNNVTINVTYRDWENIIDSNTAKLEQTLCVEYISLSTEEKRRIMNNTDPYIQFRVSKMFSESKISLVNPVRTLYFIGTPSTSSNASLSLSTPSKIIHGNDILTINHDSFIHTISDLRNLTKENVYRYYGNNGFGGRELSDSTPTKSLGVLDSIGIFTQSLEPSSYPNGHISSIQDITINKHDNDITVYIEEINFYRIVSGQYSNMVSKYN
jgi:hypothetical protein